MDWARANVETSDLARRLVEQRFYYAPYIGSLLVVLILVRLMGKALNLRGIAIGEWLRSLAPRRDGGDRLHRGGASRPDPRRPRALRAPARAAVRVARPRRLAVLPAPRAHGHPALRDRPRGPSRLSLRDPPRAAAAPGGLRRPRVSVRQGLGSGGGRVPEGGRHRSAPAGCSRRRARGRAWPRSSSATEGTARPRVSTRKPATRTCGRPRAPGKRPARRPSPANTARRRFSSRGPRCAGTGSRRSPRLSGTTRRSRKPAGGWPSRRPSGRSRPHSGSGPRTPTATRESRGKRPRPTATRRSTCSPASSSSRAAGPWRRSSRSRRAGP